ncbi:MAG: BtpA/SgcQ family protein [Candidatus Caldarchaeum sp.]
MATACMMELFGCPKPVIGMVHLRPLPGSPGYGEWCVDDVLEQALRDAVALRDGGVDGIQVENLGDKPFTKPGDVGPETVSIVSIVAREVRKEVGLPVGVFILANAVSESIAAAAACGASWVRANMYNLAYVADEGYVESAAPVSERLRNKLAPGVKVFADVLVKHGSHFLVSDVPVSYQVARLEEIGADAVVVSGFRTGGETPLESVLEVKQAASKPVFIGSGLNLENAAKLLDVADGAIVGTYFKKGGKTLNPVDVERVRKFMDVVRRLRSQLEKRS